MSAAVISQMRLSHKPVQVDPSHIVFCQNDGMVCREFFYQIHAGGTFCVQLPQSADVLLPQHLNKPDKNPRRTLCVIHRPVVILQRNVQGLGHRIQSVFGLVGQQHPGNAHRVHISERLLRPAGLQSLPPCVLQDETHVKPCIMGHKHASPAELQKFRQYFLNQTGILYHIIVNARELLDLKGNGHLRIDKCGKSVLYLPAADLHRTDFNNAIVNRRKTRGLNVKNHKVLVQSLSLVPCDNLFQIVHQVGFHTIDNLKKILPVRSFLPCLFAPVFLRLIQALPHMVGVRESLYHAMIRYGYGAVPPFVSPLHNVLGLGHTVKITHLGVTVQLHPFVCCHIHAHSGKIQYLFDPHQRAYGELMVKFVQHSHTLDLYKGPCFQIL